jgi:hypothetical protein
VLVDFLQCNKGIFVWRPAEMTGISQVIAEHTLNIKPGSKPVKQGMRFFNQEKRKAIGEDLARLLAACFIKEVQHPDWIANLVIVPKKNGK